MTTTREVVVVVVSLGSLKIYESQVHDEKEWR